MTEKGICRQRKIYILICILNPFPILEKFKCIILRRGRERFLPQKNKGSQITPGTMWSQRSGLTRLRLPPGVHNPEPVIHKEQWGRVLMRLGTEVHPRTSSDQIQQWPLSIPSRHLQFLGWGSPISLRSCKLKLVSPNSGSHSEVCSSRPLLESNVPTLICGSQLTSDISGHS